MRPEINTTTLLKRVAHLAAERISFGDKALALVQTLDEQGLLDWDSPVDSGWPLLHWSIRQPHPSLQLFTWALRQSPALLDQQDAEGHTLFQVIMDRYVREVELVSAREKNHTYNNASEFEDILAVAMECAPHHHFGANAEARENFQRQVVQLNRAKLSAAFQKACPLTVSPDQRLQLLGTLTSSTWATVRPTVSSLEDWVEVVPGVQRRFWDWALERSAGENLKNDPSFAHLPQQVQDEVRAWQRLRVSTSNAKGRPEPGKAQLTAEVQDLPRRWASATDVGCPVTWLLVRRNPIMLKELVTRADTRDTFTATDRAGHGCAFYLARVLESPLLRKSLKPHESGEFLNAFASVVNGRGLIAQWFADPQRYGYLPAQRVMPNCGAMDTMRSYGIPVGPPSEEARWLYPLLHSHVWTMPTSDATLLAQRWSSSGEDLSARMASILPLWMSKHGSEIIDASPLGPYMPLVASVSMVQYLVDAKKRSTDNGQVALPSAFQRLWNEVSQAPWCLDGLELSPITSGLLDLVSEAQPIHPAAAAMAGSLLARVRTVQADQQARTVEGVRRPRVRS